MYRGVFRTCLKSIMEILCKNSQGLLTSGSSDKRCSIKKLFLKISQYSQEATCVGVSFLVTLQTLRPATLLKRDSNTGGFQ